MLKIILPITALLFQTAFAEESSSSAKRLALEMKENADSEKKLSAIDVNSSELVFKRLNGSTLTNWKISQNGVNLASLKCTEGINSHKAAFAAYNLGKALNFNIYPVTVTKMVDRVVINNDQGNTYKVKAECVLKKWYKEIAFYKWEPEELMQSADPSKNELVKGLNCSVPKNFPKDYTFISTAKGQIRGNSEFEAVLRDFSNMLVVDMLIGNEDRFPPHHKQGGNVFFRSTTETSRDDAQNPGWKDFDSARFFSLDNDYAFVNSQSPSHHDFFKYVKRFDRAFIKQLAELQKKLQASVQKNSVATDFKYLNFEITLKDGKKKMSAAAYVLDNINQVLKRVSELATECVDEELYL